MSRKIASIHAEIKGSWITLDAGENVAEMTMALKGMTDNCGRGETNVVLQLPGKRPNKTRRLDIEQTAEAAQTAYAAGKKAGDAVVKARAKFRADLVAGRATALKEKIESHAKRRLAKGDRQKARKKAKAAAKKK